MLRRQHRARPCSSSRARFRRRLSWTVQDYRRRLLRLIAALRRPGARYRVTALAQRMMDADTEPVIVALTEAAKGGDVAAIKLMLERIAPVLRVRTVVPMPPMTSAADLPAAVGAVAEAIAAASLTPEKGYALAAVLEMQRWAFETATRVAHCRWN